VPVLCTGSPFSCTSTGVPVHFIRYSAGLSKRFSYYPFKTATYASFYQCPGYFEVVAGTLLERTFFAVTHIKRRNILMTDWYERSTKVLQLAGLVNSSVDAYSCMLRQSVDFYDKTPDLASEENLQDYHLHSRNVNKWSTATPADLLLDLHQAPVVALREDLRHVATLSGIPIEKTMEFLGRKTIG
jgi:hypothetical protein